MEAGRKEGLRGTTRVLRRKARKVGSSPGRWRAWGGGTHLERRDVGGKWVSDGEGSGRGREGKKKEGAKTYGRR